MINIYLLPGKYRLLCVINDVETEAMVKGYCRECGKQDDPDKFDQKDSDLLCCSKVTNLTITVGPQLLYSTAGR